MTMTLKEQFKTYLQLNGVETFRTIDALNWYKSAKESPGRVDYSNLYTLILKPLEAEGFIQKHIVHGMWTVSDTMQGLPEDEEASLDDFDRYIQEKLKGGSTNG